MNWRERVRQEVLAVLKEHDILSTEEEIASDIADALPSPDERNGYAIVPTEATTAQVVRGLETALKIMAEAGVDGLSPFKDYPSPTETTSRVYREMVKAASHKP